MSHQMTPMMNGNRALPPARIQSIISPPADDGSEEQPPPTPLLTQSQALEGVAVSASVIDELFKVYGLLRDQVTRYANA
jgi:hypothetical protein